MQIAEVRVFPVDEDKLKAFASIVIDDAFVVSDSKIIDGKNGRFLSMPSTKRRSGTFRDIDHPLNNETRRLIEEKIFARYDELLTEGAVPTSNSVLQAELEERSDDPQAVRPARPRRPPSAGHHAAL